MNFVTSTSNNTRVLPALRY
ncbi:hypothetical protein CCACVL1_02115 [Corchorus capsularis]|uniref:Uncharacterized protein n=1 Tax=Corchorus capsularis TaxID=210143 RepID=A0A1R3KCV0_COCAP|nr:hypothetical protein CCACVL1_02115 [Corchorus capsularis]